MPYSTHETYSENFERWTGVAFSRFFAAREKNLFKMSSLAIFAEKDNSNFLHGSTL